MLHNINTLNFLVLSNYTGFFAVNRSRLFTIRRFRIERAIHIFNLIYCSTIENQPTCGFRRVFNALFNSRTPYSVALDRFVAEYRFVFFRSTSKPTRKDLKKNNIINNDIFL